MDSTIYYLFIRLKNIRYKGPFSDIIKARRLNQSLFPVTILVSDYVGQERISSSKILPI